MNKSIPRIIGTGWQVPDHVRHNDDPIFDWLRANNPDVDKMFSGYEKRHILLPAESLVSIMAPAAEKALEQAKLKPEDIDMLIGTGSTGEFIQPNTLTEVHKVLGLPKRTWVIPVNDDYSNYASSLFIADSLIRAGRAKNILVCLGDDWSRNVDYHTPQSVSAADGAGAAVLSMSMDESLWYVVDQVNLTDSSFYGGMFVKGEKFEVDPPLGGRYPTVYSPHFFQITEAGLAGFTKLGKEEAITTTIDLLHKNKLTPADVAFLPHQTSGVLINFWLEKLKAEFGEAPGQMLSTLKKFANATVASHALNFAYFSESHSIQPDYLVMLALGMDMHANSMLLARGPA